MSEVKKSNDTVQVTYNIFTELARIQHELKAPKGQFNKFGNFNYRSCEDILEAVKPLLNDNLFLILSDEVVQVGDRYYIKAIAKLSNGKESIEVPAFARESLDKKGMDDSQITGATSSYARKYALNGLFAIDDTKDSDVDKKKVAVNTEKLLSGKELKDLGAILQNIVNCKTAEGLDKIGKTIAGDYTAKKYSNNQIKVLREAYTSKKKKLVPTIK